MFYTHNHSQINSLFNDNKMVLKINMKMDLNL